MIYLLDGTETYHLSGKKHELLNRDDVLPENIMTIDGSVKDFSLSNALMHCSTVSLFSEHRIVLIQDPYFLNPSVKRGTEKPAGKRKKKSTVPDHAEMLDNYISHYNPDCDLIFYCFGFDADKRTKEFKVLDPWIKQGRVKHLHYGNPSPQELEKWINQDLARKGIRMDAEARKELNLRINGSATQFYQAMDKILLYGEKNLTLTDIEHLVPVNQEVNVWKMADGFLSGNTAQTFRSVYEMTEIARNTYQNLVMMLAYRLRAVYNAVRLRECGYTDPQISAKTGRKYPDLDIRSAHGRSSFEILTMISELADLEQGIKSGRINDREGLEAFLLRNLNQYAGNQRTI
ncbi:MAG: DNA polymerase III subunit delta [Solobacterium sp.]|nr:DNA polymerase III subunit delta [Solobacterium sp.]